MSLIRTFPKISLFLGGARSGKSLLAENLVLQSSRKPVYLATAEKNDDEMNKRVKKHQARRGQNWRLIEEPLLISQTIQKIPETEIVLLDCLTLWLSNIMLSGGNMRDSTAQLLSTLQSCSCDVVLVSNEVGMGIVPDNQLGRKFRDAQGALNQQIAAQSNFVVFAAAGLPMVLKGQSPMVPLND